MPVNSTLPSRTIDGFSDDFNRTDGSLGATSRESKPWTLSTTTAVTSGTDSAKAYLCRTAGGPLQATADANVADGTLTTKLAVIGATGQCGLTFRWSTANDYWRFTSVNKNLYRLEKVVASNQTATKHGLYNSASDTVSRWEDISFAA